MKKNMGTLDRVIRGIIALIISGLYITGTIQGTLGVILLILGGVFLITGFIQFCPLYLPFGISTLRKKGN